MFSGSTCVSVYITQNKYYCANIGDSRAIIGQSIDKNNWVPVPLSNDHKPDLENEYQRIIQSGGRVDCFKDPEGNSVGPPRVWMKFENIPGLAMSRSFGDFIASQVGVIQEPEVQSFDIKECDKVLVVASDGVWEFLTNDMVLNIIQPFYLKNDPEGACDKIIQEAVSAWKREDDVIDDITCIVVFLNK